MQPETRYARSGDLSIAYQVVGDGPLDLVYVPGWVSHLDCGWEIPGVAEFIRRLASFSRLILLDKRGCGLSDRIPGVATLEERMDDVRAVLDAVGSKRTALLGVSEGGPMSVLFTATYPERSSALALYGTMAKFTASAEYPWGWPAEFLDQIVEGAIAGWGRLDSPVVPLLAPSLAGDERFRESWGRFERAAASPGAFAALMRMNAEIDVRHVLPTIRVPTLVLHRTEDTAVNADQGRYIAERIPGAKYVELAGVDHIPFAGDFDAIVDEIEEFLTGVRPVPEIDRVLATVLLTDIVSSTARSAQVGDRRWKDLLDQHDTLIRRELERHRGRLVKNTGDGILATFDGPARAIRCAQAIATSLKSLGIEVRAGLHTGEVELRGEDVTGIGVNIAARVMDAAGPGEVVVSSTVKDLVAGSGLRFLDRGNHDLRGVPGEWRLFAVEG